MASAFAHAVAGAALWPLFRDDEAPRRTWLAGAALAVIPDLDVIGFRFGIAYGDLLGHRGLTHSLLVAGLCGGAVGAMITPRATPRTRWHVCSYLMLAMASHGLLDTMTTGGLGVALFAPCVDTRYFLPWRPIAVSPIGIRPFLSMRGLAILGNEALWVGLPSLVVAMIGRSARTHERSTS